MAELKRRVVYVSDEDWKEVWDVRRKTDLTISEIVRRALHNDGYTLTDDEVLAALTKVFPTLHWNKTDAKRLLTALRER